MIRIQKNLFSSQMSPSLSGLHVEQLFPSAQTKQCMGQVSHNLLSELAKKPLGHSSRQTRLLGKAKYSHDATQRLPSKRKPGAQLVQSAWPGPKHVSHLELQVLNMIRRSLTPQYWINGSVSVIKLEKFKLRVAVSWLTTCSTILKQSAPDELHKASESVHPLYFHVNDCPLIYSAIRSVGFQVPI